MDAKRRRKITLQLVIDWARSGKGSTSQAAARYEAVRRFLTVAACTRRDTVVPPPRYLGRTHGRRRPHIYTDDEISDLLAATRSLTPIRGLRPWTYRTLFGLLYATGLRVGEALALDRADVDLDRGTLLVKRANHPDSSTPLARLLRSFFLQHLKVERRVSDHTVASYASTFRLLLAFCAQQRKRGAAPLELADLDVRMVLAFLRHIEAERGCSALTRNARLAAVKSFFRYVAVHEPPALPIAQRVLALPMKRFDRKLVGYLTPDEMKAVLGAPDLSTWSGRRDHAMLVTAYNTAARVSELVGLLRDDVDLAPALGTVKIHGKGRKERVAVLFRDASTVLRRWECELGESTKVLFPNRSGAAMTRSGARARLLVTVHRAAATCPSLRARRVSPHMIRHTTAMHLLQSGVNLASIALFLGHEDVQTTHGYVEADADMKRRTLAALPPLSGRQRRNPKQTDELIAFLESLQREHPQ